MYSTALMLYGIYTLRNCIHHYFSSAYVPYKIIQIYAINFDTHII